MFAPCVDESTKGKGPGGFCLLSHHTPDQTAERIHSTTNFKLRSPVPCFSLAPPVAASLFGFRAKRSDETTDWAETNKLLN